MAANPTVRKEDRARGACANGDGDDGDKRKQQGRKSDNEEDIQTTLEHPVAKKPAWPLVDPGWLTDGRNSNIGNGVDPSTRGDRFCLLRVHFLRHTSTDLRI